MDDQKNMIAAAVLSLLVIAGWTYFFVPDAPPPSEVSQTVQSGEDVPVGGVAPTSGSANVGTLDQSDDTTETAARIEIATPSMTGSISLKGGRIDDTHLVNYKDTLDFGADTVVQLSPIGTAHPYFAVYGWLSEGGAKTPAPNTIWAVETGEKLTPATPVTLVWDNGEGLTFRRQIAVDDKYMFTITQSVENATGETVSLSPYGYVARRGLPELENFFILHEGAVAAYNNTSEYLDYDDLEELETVRGNTRSKTVTATDGGYVGFTDKYWMTTLAAAPHQAFTAVYKYSLRNNGAEFRTEALFPAIDVAAGTRAETQTYLFSGAKEFAVIAEYQDKLNIARFEESIDWGWFYFLTKPIFKLLLWVKSIVGNMGWSIIVLTLIIKAVLFPLAYKSYVSMSKMKKLQPEMEKLKERHGDDRQAMQKDMMALYKREKANPAAGCLPILLQIPIFFSLYKVLFVTIEMRHAPFMLWIHDLSAPDPTSILNLFGLLPWDAPDPASFLSILSIGVFPILMGVTMWMQQKLNPAPTDKMQAQIFAWMPWIFMFMLGSFASGLVIYWCANNILTFTQQYAIMRSQGVDVDFLGNVKKTFKRKPKEG
ncbi:MAG: membrane protein insertase YidC [Pikeienuella sp.]